MKRPVWLTLLLLAGCAKPHPLLTQQEALTALAQTQPPGEAHAVVQIGKPLVKAIERYGAERLVAEVPKQIPVDIPLLGQVVVKPGLKRPALTVNDAQCDGCLRVDGQWSGRMTAGQQGPLDWSANTKTTLALTTRDTLDGGQELVFSTAPAGTQDVNVKMEGLSPMLSRLVSGLVSAEIEHQLRDGALAEPVPLLELAPTAPHVHGVGLDTKRGLAASPTFVALHHGAVSNVPDPGEGFVAVVPSETLLGLVHAAMVWQEPVRGYAPEPVSLELRPDGTFSLGLTVWKAKRSAPKGRDYTLEGTMALDDDMLVFEVTDAASTGGWGGDPKSFLIDKQLNSALEGGTRFEVPAVRDVQIGDDTFTVRATKLTVQGDQLQLFGTVDLPSDAAPRKRKVKP